MEKTTVVSTLKAGFQNSFAALPKKFYEAIMPETVHNPVLQKYNWKLSRELGLNFTEETQELTDCLAGNLVFADSTPIAMAYARAEREGRVSKYGWTVNRALARMQVPNGTPVITEGELDLTVQPGLPIRREVKN